jgi:hypothetical protein
MLFTLDIKAIHKKYKVHTHIHINIVKENKTIKESNKKSIQKDKIKPIILIINIF